MRSFDFIRLALIGCVVLLTLLFVIRLFPFLRFILLIVLVILLVCVLLYFYKESLDNDRTQAAFNKTIPGQISQRILFCKEQINKIDKETEQLSESIQEMNHQLSDKRSLSDNVIKETNQLLDGFEQELQLRRTKKTFFLQCIHQLETLLKRHELLNMISEKKKELERYQESHYDDLASMEHLRWDIEKETVSLDTIQELSTRMLNSTAVQDALHLQGELDKMLS